MKLFLGVIYFDMGIKNPKLILDDFEFLLLRKKAHEVVWTCRKYFHPKIDTERCKVRIVTRKRMVTIFGKHNHLPNSKTSNRVKLKPEIVQIFKEDFI